MPKLGSSSSSVAMLTSLYERNNIDLDVKQTNKQTSKQTNKQKAFVV